MLRYRPARHRYLFPVGDVNPTDYDGGWVVRIYPDGQRPYVAIEYVVWLGDDDDSMGYLYRANIPPDVAAEHDWIDVADIVRYTGADPDEWRANARDPDIRKRARCTEDIASYYGWDNLDSYPIEVTRVDVRKRYARARGSKSYR